MWIAAILACRKDDPDSDPVVPVVLTDRLGPGEARAGVITDERALFGGISAEGRAGDIKLYNDRVQFVVQSVRPGSYYLPEGGGVIDADIVRPEGQLGHDAVEEWGSMYGLGRITVPESVVVVSDGSDGGPAIVRVTGYEGPLGLLEGALEAPGLILDLQLEMTVEYVLRPDSWLLEVRSTATATTSEATFSIGDLLMGADEVLSTWVPGAGLGTSGSLPRPWTGYQGDRNDVALILAAPAGDELSVTGYELLTELASMAVGFGPTEAVPAGGSLSWTRSYGVGPDLATLSAAVLAARGEDTQEVAGQVTAPDGPVAGARVVVDLDGAPYTVAVTDAEGRFSTRVPAAGSATVLAVGRGPGLFVDLPPGATSGSPYAAAPVQDAMRAGLAGGALPVPAVEGRGVASAADPLVLGQPGAITVSVADGLPFTLRVGPGAPDTSPDPARVPGRPDGLAAAGWSRDGELTVAVEPGTYAVVAHRGPRYELFEETVTVGAGETVALTAALPEAFEHPGWVLGDPHSHGSPSSDAAIPMEDRLIVTSAVGLQVHFGTDHDHLADYRPLLAPLGLAGVLKSVVADEVSPPVRGHFNIWPVAPDPGAPNHGAWTWWTEIPESTEAIVDTLRERHGDGFVLQSNHPTDAGMASSAGWQPGVVGDANAWTDRIEAVEVMNAADQEEFLAFWFDLTNRGRRVTPVGVSDSHSHFGGHVGWSATWFEVGTDDPTAVDDEAITKATREGRVAPMRGPFLVLDPVPGATVGPGTELRVEVRSASWVAVDRILLLRDGAEVERVEGTAATFVLSPEADASYVVVAEGDRPMSPVTSDTPWALGGPYRVDVGGDGWTPPLPDLTGL